MAQPIINICLTIGILANTFSIFMILKAIKK